MSARVTQIYAVLEVGLSDRMGRRRDDRVAGKGLVWFDTLAKARAAAQWIAATTLAHRVFIVKPPDGSGGKPEVVEEVLLAPLAERVRAHHLAVLRARDPRRYAHEARGDRWTAPAFARPQPATDAAAVPWAERAPEA